MSEVDAVAAGSLAPALTAVWQARVAVPAPLGQAFSYLVPAPLRTRTQRGARVLCELGRRKVLGVVLEVAERVPDIPLERMKSIVAVVDAEPVLPEELLSFLQALASYYVAPIGIPLEAEAGIVPPDGEYPPARITQVTWQEPGGAG